MITQISEGMRIFRHSLDKKVRGHKRYNGNAEEICSQIVKECWNGHYFQTSTGHFSQFYARDFGLCVDSLLKLGYRKEAEETLRYAMRRYALHNRITVAITPGGKPFDFPYFGIDTVAFMLRSLRLAKAKSLVEGHRHFLNREVFRIYHAAIDKNSGLVKRGVVVSSMKDYARRKSSCYDNVMVAVMKKELTALKLDNPFRHYNYEKLLKDYFWNGSYFLDDLSGKEHVAGDANIFPYWAGLFRSKPMLKKSIDAIRAAGLDKPFPLKYTAKHVKQDMIAYELLVKGWQRDAIWTQLGPVYIRLLKGISKKEADMHIAAYTDLIERNMSYMEVFTSSGRPFNTAFYHSDAGMLWASLYLDLVRK